MSLNTKEKNKFAINNQIIENVKECKYLGITINRKGSFTPTLEDLSSREAVGSPALYAIASKIHLKDTPIKTMIKILGHVLPQYYFMEVKFGLLI